MATGKSTAASKLAQLTKIPNVPMDRVRWYYYFKDGFSLERESELSSFQEKLNYWKPFEVKAVRRILKEFPHAIIDFGAGHSYYPNEGQFEEVALLLQPLPNIFLLLPSVDKKKSLAICNQRLAEVRQRPLEAQEIESNRDFIQHESNYRLAKHIVYSEGKTPQEVAEEINGICV